MVSSKFYNNVKTAMLLGLLSSLILLAGGAIVTVGAEE